jgi:outer membrane protein assembly factor BamE (lipoprotein component of BamABCDE complex)
MSRTIHAVRAGVVVALTILLGACATTLGRSFDEAYAQQIKPGETTKADVRRALGRPLMVQATDDHQNDVWTYAYYEGGGFGVTVRNWFAGVDPANPYDASQASLVIRFTGDKVKEASFTRQLPLPDKLEQAYR